MATFVQKSTELFADNAASIAPSLSGCTAGNHVAMLVAQSIQNTNGTLAAPSGWSSAIATTAGGALAFRPNIAIFYKENISSGVHSGTVTLNNTGSYAAATIVETSGIALTSSLGPTSTNTTDTATLTSGGSGTTATTTTTGIAFAIGHAEDGVGSTAAFSSPATTGYTVVDTEATNSVHIAYDSSYKILSSTGTQSANWTWTTNSAFHGGVAVFYDAAPTGPTINKQPSSVSIQDNEYTQLQVFATTSGGALSYQWQDNRGGSFANCSDGTGATSQFYNTARLATANSGRQYRCAVTDSNGTTNSSAATITVVNGGTANLGRWGPELRIDAWF